MIVNILTSVFAKLISLFSSLMAINLLLNGMGNDSYSVWVTLTSVVTWLVLFDLGLGNSLKNSISIKGNKDFYREYSIVMSFSFYISFGLLFVLMAFCFYWDNETIDRGMILSVYIPMIIFFPLKNYGFALQGLRKVGLNNIIESFRILIWLVFVYLYKFEESSNITSLIPLFVLANIAPSFIQFLAFSLIYEHKVKFKLVHLKNVLEGDSLKIGIRFFIIQLSSILLFGIGNIIIASNFSISDVAMYDTYNKIFVSGLSIFNMVIAVAWPEFASFYAKGKHNECYNLYRKLLCISCFFSFGVFIVCYFFSDLLLFLGVVDEIGFNPSLAYAMGGVVVLQSFAYCGAVYLNATNILDYQIRLAGLSITLLLPIFYFLKFLGLGLLSYTMATTLVVSISVIACNYKAVKAMRGMNVH